MLAVRYKMINNVYLGEDQDSTFSMICFHEEKNKDSYSPF